MLVERIEDQEVIGKYPESPTDLMINILHGKHSHHICEQVASSVCSILYEDFENTHRDIRDRFFQVARMNRKTHIHDSKQRPYADTTFGMIKRIGGRIAGRFKERKPNQQEIVQSLDRLLDVMLKEQLAVMENTH